jgi:hypothetical protein
MNNYDSHPEQPTPAPAGPPNLRAVYGKRYRVGRDESTSSNHDPFLHVIPTRTGEVYAPGPGHAGVEVERRFRTVHARLREAGFAVHQQGDDLTTYLVPWADLERVLPWLRPWKRRRYSEEYRKVLAARMGKINARRRAHETGHNSGQNALEAVEVGQQAV